MAHSSGGTSAARATERYPQKIHCAVYVTATMLASGKAQTDPDHKDEFEATSKDLVLNYGNGRDNPPTSCMPSLEVVKHVWYNCSSSEVGIFLFKILSCCSREFYILM